MTVFVTIIGISIVIFFVFLIYSMCCVAHDADEFANYQEEYGTDFDEMDTM